MGRGDSLSYNLPFRPFYWVQETDTFLTSQSNCSCLPSIFRWAFWGGVCWCRATCYLADLGKAVPMWTRAFLYLTGKVQLDSVIGSSFILSRVGKERKFLFPGTSVTSLTRICVLGGLLE